jgi:hypothetical protein
MEVKSYFQAPEGYAYVHHTLHLFGEIIYSTDEVEYQQDDFELVTVKQLNAIIEQWRLENGDTKSG